MEFKVNDKVRIRLKGNLYVIGTIIEECDFQSDLWWVQYGYHTSVFDTEQLNSWLDIPCECSSETDRHSYWCPADAKL